MLAAARADSAPDGADSRALIDKSASREIQIRALVARTLFLDRIALLENKNKCGIYFRVKYFEKIREIYTRADCDFN